VVDHFTRLPLAIHLFPADRNEEQEYETIYGIATGNTGKDPVLVAGDRGLSFSHIFEFNTRHGVGSVFQYRRFGAKLPVHAPRGENYDEHGVPECQHCGGLTDFVRFALDKGTGSPRLWVRCAFPVTDKCEKEQAISCSKDWRRLLPVWRTHPAYEAMTESHQIYEGKHAALRRNYLVGPDDDKLRPCRVGIHWQQLRANCALFLEWLRFDMAGGLGACDVVETGWERVAGNIARRRWTLGLIGGGIATHSSRRRPKPPSRLKPPPGEQPEEPVAA
jgi:hypothetical protein